jgi:rhodanese-related sulfurtransferase
MFIPITSVRAAEYTEIDVHTAYSMINNHTQYPNLLILDVREQSEYDVNHLYNSTLIPLNQIDSRISELMPYNDTEIIVYCRSGFRGEVASQNLAGNHNFTKVFNMAGAINAWIAAGYPVWIGNNSQPSIRYPFSPFILMIFGTMTILLLYIKKRGIIK